MVFVPLLPYPTTFLHPSKKLHPAIVISSHMEEKQSMYYLKDLKDLKDLKEKTLSLGVNG